MPRPAIFVDRDDTLMIDVGYCRDPDQVEVIPLAAEGLRLLADAGYTIVVVTNQSGLRRGYFSEDQLEAVNACLRERLRVRGGDFHALYYCPHRPDDGCDCRKPRPGLLFRAAADLDLELSASYMIGDSDMDLQAGKSAGTRTVLIRRAKGSSRDSRDADYTARNLVEAAKMILSKNHGVRKRTIAA